MFKSFQDTSALQQFHGFPNLNMQQATSAYGFSGVTFWLDAAYGLNTQTNLGAVSSWQQRVGGGTFVQATAGSQPRLILNDANYNNLPSVESVDTSRHMISNNGLRLNISGFTIAVISKVNIEAVNFNGIFTIGAADADVFFDGGVFPGFNGFGLRTAATNRIQGNTESTNPRIKIITGNNIVVVNGISETITGTIGSVNVEFLRLFGQGGSQLRGTIAEIIAFGYSMTSDEAIALSNNINQKYAIY